MTVSNDLFAQTQRVMQRLEKENKGASQEESREAMIAAVAETYSLEGREPNLEEIAEAVDRVMAEDALAASIPPKQKLPMWVWVVGTVVAVPLLIPISRILIRLVEVLVRVAI